MTTKTRLFAVLALSWSLSALAQPAVPTKVNFTARLVDSGAPVTGTRNLVFSLYPTLVGGTAVWTETRNNLTVTDGMVNVDLGASTPLTDTILDGQTLYLEVTVGTQTLTPRTAVLSVPYALRSTVAGRVGTLQESDIQKRVGSTCAPGSAIRSINADGTVVCQASAVTDAGSTISNITAGLGLTGGGAVGDVSLAVAFSGSGTANTAARSDHAHTGVYLPVGTSRTCATGQKVTGIDASGNVTCTADTVYDVVAGGGVTKSATNQFALISCSVGQQLVATSVGWGCSNPLGVQSVSASAPLVVGGTASAPSLSLGTVPLANGGTGATSAAAARSNLGAAASGANSDITALNGLTTPLPGASGGTGIVAPTTAGLVLKSSASGWTAGALVGADLPPGTQAWAAQPSCAVGSVVRSISATGVPTCESLPPQMAAAGNGGLVVGGTTAAPSIGLVQTGCPSGATMRWNGANWGCIQDVISVAAPDPSDGGRPSGIVVSNPNGPNVQLGIAPTVPNFTTTPQCPANRVLKSIATDGTPNCVGPVPVDWYFNLSFMASATSYAHLWVTCLDGTGACTTTVPSTYAFGSNATSSTVTVTRTSVGMYTVNIPWMSGGIPQVTAYGGDGSIFCKVSSWGGAFSPATGSNVYVICFDTTP